jgi:hypothetical protein
MRTGVAFPASRDLSWRRCLIAALPAWVVARVIVVATFLLSGGGSVLVWDAAWYHNLGVDGYGPYGANGSRFFPLLPAIIGGGSWLGLPAPVWQLAVCWAGALFFAAAVYRLTVLETGDEASAQRAAWLIQLVPGANVLALGYTEAVAGVLAVLYFLFLRSAGDARVGFATGLLSGLARPTGPLLAVPAIVEGVRAARGGDTRRSREPQRGAVGALLGAWRYWLVALSPVLGTGAYLTWVWITLGDPLTPYRVHSASDLRGGVASAPWDFMLRTSPGGYAWPLVLALLAVAVVALYLTWRLLPLSYLGWALPTVGLAVTAWGLHSLPRYLAAVFPLWMAVAIACRRRWVFVAVMSASAAAFTWVAWLTVDPTGPVP